MQKEGGYIEHAKRVKKTGKLPTPPRHGNIRKRKRHKRNSKERMTIELVRVSELPKQWDP